MPMIQKYVEEIALQMGIKLSRISVVEGRKVGCIDMHLLNLSADGHSVSTLLYQSELDEMQSGLPCLRLEIKIRAALSRLQVFPSQDHIENI
jgi:hypothetical protein